MSLLAWSALALSVSGSDDASKPGSEWLALDREVEALASGLAAAPAEGFALSAWIKSAYRSSDDVTVNGNDLGGFTVQGVRLTAQGKVGPVELKYGIDGASGGVVGPVSTKDAFVRTRVAERTHVQVGNFRAPFLFTAVASDEKEIFFNRSTQGALWRERELGLMFDGSEGAFTWWLSGQNGGDGGGDDWLTIAKGAYAVAGDPIPPKQTGGYGVDSPTRVQVGVGYAEDRSAQSGDARAFSGEVTLIAGRIFAHGEVVDYGDGFVPGSIAAGQAKPAANANLADTTPFGVTLGVMITPKDEVAVRYDDAHETADTHVWWAGYTRYVQGHAVKWQLNFTQVESDAGDVADVLAGLTFGI